MRRLFGALASALLVVGVAPTMLAGPAAAATGDYGGSAATDLVHATALNIPNTLKLAEAGIAPSKAEVDSKGGLAGGAKSHARATNVDANLINGQIPLNGLLVQADQSAPPDQGKEATGGPLLSVPIDPLLHADVTTAHARARWESDTTCVPVGTPISTARSEVANAEVLTGTPLGTAVVALNNKQGTTVYTDSSVALTDVAGQTGKGVMSTSLTQLTSITLFKGTSNQLTVNVLAPPKVTAVATGNAATSSVTYTEPVLQVVDNTGKVLGELNTATMNTTLDLSPLAVLKLGTLDKKIAADGTSASGTANLLEVTVLTTPLPIDPLAKITIAGGTVSATVPVGGVNCAGGGENGNPLRDVHKDVSAYDVAPGSTFDYTVVVPNRGSCTLTNVKVVDTISGPAGTMVVGTVPPPTTTSGLSMTWNDIGPIAPNETKVIKISVKAPADAQVGAAYHNHVDVSANCNGQSFSQPFDLSGPVISGPGTGGCNVQTSNMAASHTEVTQGETFNYYIHVFNQGNQPCTGVGVVETLIPQVSFVSSTDGGSNSGATVTWNLGMIGPGDSRTVVATVKVNPSTPAGTHLPGSAVITPANGTAKKVSTPGPVVTANSVLAPPNPARRQSVQAAELPKTGGSIPTGLALGLSLAGLAAAWLRRKVAVV